MSAPGPPAAQAGAWGMGRALREVLDTACYDEAGIRDLIQFEGLDPAWGAAGLRLRPNADQRLPLLVRLFVAGEPLSAGAVAQALAPVELGALEEAGLLERAGGEVRAVVRLDALQGIVVASDFRERDGGTAREHVVYPGGAAVALASLTIRAPVARTLDLCCGSGVQALLAARHSETVIATDLNPRALRLAELSAALSAVENVQWREGDLFAPIADDERFDLIVANPPFVISPTRELIFRDGGHRSDELSEAVLLGIAERLNEGAYGHMLCSWVHTTDEDWAEPARRWLAGSGCDAVALRFHTQTPATYAITWTAADGGPPAQAVERAASWVEYYRSLAVERITTAFLALRRRRGRNWVHADEFVRPDWNGGSHVARVFEGYDALERLPDERALLVRPLKLATGVTLIERHRPGQGVDRARLASEGGLALPGRIGPPALAAALLALDAQPSLAQAATSAGLAPDVLDAGLGCVRDLVRRGYLIVS